MRRANPARKARGVAGIEPLAPALALSIFVALPMVFALTYRRRYY